MRRILGSLSQQGAGSQAGGEGATGLESLVAREWLRWTPVAAILLALYGSTLWSLVLLWWNTPDYTYCFFVPPFAAYVLWRKKDALSEIPAGEGNWLGLLLLIPTVAMLMVSARYYLRVLDALSIIVTLAGLVLFLGGWRMLKWAAPGLAFLVFMVPPPGYVIAVWSQPLQRIGTIVSTFFLQLAGIPAIAQGNVIQLREAQIGVVEACSGLRIMTVCLAVCVGACLVTQQAMWRKVVIVLSALPIALLANVFRIFVTAVLYELAHEDWAKGLFHDLAGWLAMPLVIGLLMAEMVLLEKLVDQWYEFRETF